MNQMSMVRALDAAFETKSDEKADRNGEEMEQKVANAVDRFVRRMNVEHLGLVKEFGLAYQI